MNRWIGEKDNSCRARCYTQDFCSHVSRRVHFRVQGRPLFPIFTAAKPLSMLEWMVTMFWIQLQAEARMQSNTDKSCNSLHLSSEYWPKSQPSISRRGTRWLLGHRSEEIYAVHSQQWRHIRLMKIGTNTTLYFNCIVRQDFCWATSSRPSTRTTTRRHYTSIEEACILSLDNDNDTSRNDSSDNTRIPFRLSTHKYLDSCQLSNHHDPLTLSSSNLEKLLSSISQDAHVLRYRRGCENSFKMRKCLHHGKWPRQSIDKRGSVGQKVRSHERESNRRGGDAVFSCSVTVLNMKPLLRSNKSSYGLQTESCYKSCCVYN